MEIMMNSNPHSGNRRFRVVRGGGWNYYAQCCRSAARSYNSPYYNYNSLGFRIVKPTSTGTSNKNPVGASSGLHRVIRGGSWYDDAQSCHSASRYNGDPSNYPRNAGFRAVKTTSTDTDKNPVGASSGSYHVIRGGGWDGDTQYCRSAYRDNDYPDDGYDNIGFRAVQTISTDTDTDKNPVGASSGSYRVIRGGDWYFGALYCRSAARSNRSPYGSDYIGFRVIKVSTKKESEPK